MSSLKTQSKRNFRNVVAIDPGISTSCPGAIVVGSKEGDVYEIHKMPHDLDVICAAVYNVFLAHQPTSIAIEKVGFWVEGHNPQSACKLADHSGVLKGMSYFQLGALPRLVAPSTWKAFVPNKPKPPPKIPRSVLEQTNSTRIYGQRKAQHNTALRNAIKEYAKELYPQEHITHWNAAALVLFAYHTDRVLRGTKHHSSKWER